MAFLLALQIALPLALLLWLALRPLKSRLGFVVQVVATAAVLIALHLAGLWLAPPWWTPWLWWILFGGALALAVRRLPLHALPTDPAGWTATILLAALGSYGAMVAASAWSGRQPPDAPTVDLAFPLPPGRYYVANGGTTGAISSHAKTLDRSVPRFRAWHGQSYGVDIVAIDRLGLQADGVEPRDPAAYRIFGRPVLAPCAGAVVSGVDGLPDMPVPRMDQANMAGNHVVLACEGRHILLAHMRKGSVAVRPGEKVRLGRRLGDVGNSGNSSMPHLHIHAQSPGPPGSPFAGDPLPLRLRGIFPVRGDRF